MMKGGVVVFDLNRKILVLRYGTNILQNCIEEHIKVCEDNGFCWFGKIGRAPSVKAINDVFENEKGAVILYSKDECYLCKAEGISYDQPKCGYPSYYDDYIYNKGLSPSMYVKLTSIEKISTNDLEKLVVSSSKNKLITTLNKSMNSFFVAEVVGADSNRKNVAKSTMAFLSRESVSIPFDESQSFICTTELGFSSSVFSIGRWLCKSENI